MALSVTQTEALSRILKPGMRVASMGYPDLIAPLFLGEVDGLKYREDSEAICKRHGLPLRKIPDAQSYFALKDCKLDVYDVVQERGCEILCDLNMQIRHETSYDIVLDVGTTEHCFNVAQAIMNMAGFVRIGGYILHENPFNWGNHGFYNLNPTFFVDFYEANGFKMLECKLANKKGDYINVPPGNRFRYTESEMNVFAMAQRVTIQPFVYPVQRKYAHLIPAAGADRAKEVSK